MTVRTRRAPNRNARSGQCGWPEGDGCTHVGPLRPNGLCLRHYNMLRYQLREPGERNGRYGRHDDQPTPLVCVCPTPTPQPCRILGGVLPIPGAFECSRCFRQTTAPSVTWAPPVAADRREVIA